MSLEHREAILDSVTTDPKRRKRYRDAAAAAQSVYGNDVFVRGLIEISNICRNDCYYCGIRRGNAHAERYRLTFEEIRSCCREGYDLGFRTFVLQGGEDPALTDDLLCDWICSIKTDYPDCALTLSLGERSKASYKALFEAGADRYLLRHETADPQHYRKLHPPEMSFENRVRCLWDLKEIGFQVGAGLMVGSPGQTKECIEKDLEFLAELQPHMIGIGPFIHAANTPFEKEKSGTLLDTLDLLARIRLRFPHVLLPSTTALGTIHPYGRELGILCGGNVVMPNLSPLRVRNKYLLYDDKICTGEEAAEGKTKLEARIRAIGYRVVVDRGDYRA